MGRKFVRCREDFVCEHCGKSVAGDGYTNHCSFCLYSKHVDVNPGDRSNKCMGLMEPVSVEMKGGGVLGVIVHRCLKCRATKRNRLAKNDSIETVLLVMKGVKK